MTERTPESRELAIRARDGDETAFAELVRRYQGAALGLALRITGNAADAEDAVQDAFLRAYRALPRFDPERPFGPWILRITANRALTRAGRRKKERPLELAADMPEESRSMDETLAGKEEVERLRRAMGELTPSDRAILSLRYDQGLRISEICRVLGLRESAAKVRLLRARERLMRTMSEEEGTS